MHPGMVVLKWRLSPYSTATGHKMTVASIEIRLWIQPVDATHWRLREQEECCKWHRDPGFITRKARKR